MSFVRKVLGSILVSAFASAAAHAGPNCDLSMTPSNVNVTWNQNFSSQPVTFTIRKRKNKACNWAVTFSRGGASDYSARRLARGADQLPYQLYGDSALTRVLKEFPEAASSNDALTGSFDATDNRTVTATYYLSIPFESATTPAYRPAGAYTDTVALRLYEVDNLASPGQASLEQTSSITFTTVVPKVIDLSIVSSGAGFDPGSVSRALNFGTLTQGESLAFDLLVRSNAGYVISLSSQNNGVMRHASSSVSTTVPYTLRINGSARDLVGSQTQPVAVASAGGQTSTGGIRNPADVTIGSVSDRVAGDYSDSITVTATTTE